MSVRLWVCSLVGLKIRYRLIIDTPSTINDHSWCPSVRSKCKERDNAKVALRTKLEHATTLMSKPGGSQSSLYSLLFSWIWRWNIAFSKPLVHRSGAWTFTPIFLLLQDFELTIFSVSRRLCKWITESFLIIILFLGMNLQKS